MKPFALAAATLSLFLVPQDTPPSPPEPTHAAFDLATLREEAVRTERVWSPFLERDTLQTGLYRLPAGATDGQGPHELDEVYFVTKGKAKLRVGGEDLDAQPGSILFVAAHEPHRFVEITEDLEVVVFFSKVEVEER
jgi:quercetin dioxygenase-like cupin family protein